MVPLVDNDLKVGRKNFSVLKFSRKNLHTLVESAISAKIPKMTLESRNWHHCFSFVKTYFGEYHFCFFKPFSKFFSLQYRNIYEKGKRTRGLKLACQKPANVDEECEVQLTQRNASKLNFIFVKKLHRVFTKTNQLSNNFIFQNILCLQNSQKVVPLVDNDLKVGRKNFSVLKFSRKNLHTLVESAISAKIPKMTLESRNWHHCFSFVKTYFGEYHFCFFKPFSKFFSLQYRNIYEKGKRTRGLKLACQKPANVDEECEVQLTLHAAP